MFYCNYDHFQTDQNCLLTESGNPSGGTNNKNGLITPDEDREFGAVIRYS